MGSSIDGSPAAQGAQDTAEDDQQRDVADVALDERDNRGFFGRLFGAFAPGEDRDAAADAPEEHHGIANLRRLRVDDVAVPKAEIKAVSIDIGLKELVAVFREEGYSRLPVYENSLDNPLGMVLLKDLALRHDFTSHEPFDLRTLLRPIMFAPPSMTAAVLLQKMQRERMHLALVIDEYGGVDGLVTIEDLIETIIGEIDDEHDEVAGALWVQDKQGNYIVQSRASLDAFEKATGLELRREDDDEDVNTIGGLIFVRAGRVPRKGEVVEHESGARFEVLDGDPRRIKRLRVHLPEVQPA
ncbi:hemolysin family protein [Falsirhodobacter sp. 20TX0035]|uniref:hemolysin family protein n=1 Tax=Falsirhodobacter sp. 20TX0035 TaxID=3022019 RepID=UPI00232B063C|nr:hemolysin family protein [Falsirhodobacter sp. 20TX0035]MDB6452269.1 hemolysin family protein [Falsirhodobacter sp. 20TX0035]